PRTAEQREALPFLRIGQRRRLMRAVVDLAAQDASLAGAARAVAAAVRDHEVGAHRGLQHRFVRGAVERMVARLYNDLHGSPLARGADEAVVRFARALFRDRIDRVLRVLLIGCGDIALRTAALLRHRVRLYGVTRRADDVPRLRERGIVPIVADLDRGASLARLRTAPFGVLHFAPPPSEGRADPRT